MKLYAHKTHEKGNVMKHNIMKRILSALLSLGMVASSAAHVLALDNLIAKSEAPLLSEQAEAQAAETEEKDEDLIELANNLANGTHTYFPDSTRSDIVIENKTMSINYGLVAQSGEMYVKALSNTKGAAYIENTFDVFVEKNSGEKYYASNSIIGVTPNIYRYGYYYYENRIEGQVFISDMEITNPYTVSLRNPSTKHDITVTSSSNNKLAYTTNSGASDPYFGYDLGTKFGSWWITEPPKAENYDFVEITAKITDGGSSGMLFLAVGATGSYNDKQSKTFSIVSDGEFHTYQIPLTAINDYTGNITGIRFDIGGTVEVSSIRLFKSNLTGIDAALSIQRSFLTYSDKLHHLTQFSTSKEITDIANVGVWKPRSRPTA